MALISINPATEEKIGEYPELSLTEISSRTEKADMAFQAWRKLSFADRAKPMKRLAVLLKANSRMYGEIMTKEMGKPITAAVGEVEKCALACDFYADSTEKFLQPEMILTDARESYAQFDPLGIILSVMPWNFPFWQAVRAAAPALMAGNVMILKHASNVPLCGITLEKIFLEAGFPEGVFQNFSIKSDKVAMIINDPRIKAATLTGSEHAGSKVAEECGKVLKKTVMELGGSDPFIVLEDANIEEAAKVAVESRYQNCGQSCIAAKRFIIVEAKFNEFVEFFKKYVAMKVMGDPMEEKTQIGPLATAAIRDDIKRQVEESVKMGAKKWQVIRDKGQVIRDKGQEKKGFFYEPTVMTNVNPEMPVFKEETFGPVAAIISAKNTEEAIFLANQTDLGLGSSLWTADLEKAKMLAGQIQAGAVFINGMVKSDPRLPFGGVGKSGYGRELSHYGIKEFLNVKTVWVK